MPPSGQPEWLYWRQSGMARLVHTGQPALNTTEMLHFAETGETIHAVRCSTALDDPFRWASGRHLFSWVPRQLFWIVVVATGCRKIVR